MSATPFAHAAEAEIAALLDAYGVAYAYEPHRFPLDDRPDVPGDASTAFTPDFYLPEFGTYLEIGAGKAANAGPKRRKVRAFAARYPEHRIVLIERSDLITLLTRYGRAGQLASVLGPAGALT